jgi:hypothetical protein
LHTGEGEPVTDETLREFGLAPENTGCGSLSRIHAVDGADEFFGFMIK